MLFFYGFATNGNKIELYRIDAVVKKSTDVRGDSIHYHTGEVSFCTVACFENRLRSYGGCTVRCFFYFFILSLCLLCLFRVMVEMVSAYTCLVEQKE